MVLRTQPPKEIISPRLPIKVRYGKGSSGNPCFIVKHSFTEDVLGTFFCTGNVSTEKLEGFRNASFDLFEEFMFLEFPHMHKDLFPKATDWLEEAVEVAILYWYPEIAVNEGWEKDFDISNFPDCNEYTEEKEETWKVATV